MYYKYIIKFVLDIRLIQATLAEERPEHRAALVGENARHDGSVVIEFGVGE